MNPPRRFSESDATYKLAAAAAAAANRIQQNSSDVTSVTPPTITNNLPQSQRRNSVDVEYNRNDMDIVKCRYPKCESSTTPNEAKKNYKSCHNCSHKYCSRECRRLHWEKHRKACLHSRVSALCRQVLSACKDDADTLRHLSLLARKGFLTQGRGVVRILFRSPESAEMFVKQGFQCIGEASYVRWPELLPQEMGAELYSELLRLSTEYKTDSKMLIFVAICVVSETPGSAAAPVKWERQLVSRCAKLKLSKLIPTELAQSTVITTTAATTTAANPQSDPDMDILILMLGGSASTTTTNAAAAYAPTTTEPEHMPSSNSVNNLKKTREQVLLNIQQILKRRGVNLRKTFPEVFQRLNSYVEGTTDRFPPVTIHPRDTITGRAFICIIMSDKIKLPDLNSQTNNVQIIDLSAYTSF